MVTQFASLLAESPFVKEYTEIMREMRKLDIIQDFEEPTPTIVVFGDQSNGKSSVLQRLAGGLPLLRGANRCTLVPFEIRMLKAETTLRTISLRFVEDKHARSIPAKEVEFSNITYASSKREIEEKLREAQRCVLNPGAFLREQDNLRLPVEDELEYTRNTVCVTISGPDQTCNLFMIDLPGFVRDYEEHEEFVMRLVEEYISKDSTILVPVFSAAQDINTQAAWRLAREADPQGQRTVGVLTKIDKIITDEDDKHGGFVNLVKGNGEHQLKNGTYVVRNPNTNSAAGRSETNEDPNKLEQDTINKLKTIRPWRDVPPDRYGLQNLARKLSELIGDVRDRTWPLVRPQLEGLRNEIAGRLRNLPQELSGNPVVRFMEQIGIYDKLFTTHANAENVDHSLYRGQQWNFGQFDQALVHTRPRYKLAFDDELINEMFEPINPGSLQCLVWPQKLLDNTLLDNWSDSFNQETKYTWSLKQLCEIVQSSQGGQIVGYFPYKAVVGIVKTHQEKWLDISTTLLDKNFKWVNSFNNRLIENNFKEFPNAVEEIKRISTNLLKQCKEETRKHLEDLEEMEHISANRALYVTDEATVLKRQSKYFTIFRILSAGKGGTEISKSILDLTKKLQELMHGNYDDSQENFFEFDRVQEEFDRVKRDLSAAISKLDMSEEASQRLAEEISSFKLRSKDVPSIATLSMMITIKYSYLNKILPGPTEDFVNKSILESTIGEHAFLAATGALAYWKMSHTKFREIVPRIVEFYLVHQFARRLGMYLRTYFKLLGPGLDNNPPDQGNGIDLKDLLNEDPQIAENRKEWSEQIEALDTILGKIRKTSVRTRARSYGSGDGGGSGSRRRRDKK